ncbi:MAG: hypothetical protein RR585_01935 [Coprobacillus sp.]
MEILIEGNVNLPEKFVETEYGEWSHTMNRIKKVKSLDNIKFKVGDVVYVVSEGTYSRYKYTK